MTQSREIEEDQLFHEDHTQPSPNEQLLRYIGMRASSLADTDGGYLVRADASFIGTDFA